MSALLWKELRENLKWAVIMLLALGAAEVFGLYQSRNGQSEYYDYSSGVTLCKSSFLIVTSFGCAAVGTLLGLVQVLPELKRDRWAALLHRPVPRETIFLGKVVSGLILYALAVLPPFLLCVWLVATPGHFAAPFVSGMTRPGWADLAAGAVYYFAALALSLQRGRFVLTKVLPLLAALHLSFFAVSTPWFADALMAALAMAVVLGFAARGAMRSQELFGGRSWFGRATFLAIAFYGFCGLGDLAQYLYGAVVTEPSVWTRYEMTDKGQPFKLTYRDSVVTSIEDLDGKAPQDPNLKADRIRNHVRYLNQFSNYIGDAHGFVPWRYNRSYRETYTYLWAGNPFTFPRLEQWFFLVKERTLVGVLPNKRVTIGRLGANGFQPPSATATSFPPGMDLQSLNSDGYLLHDSQRILKANFPKQEVRELELPAPGPIYGAGTAWGRDEDGTSAIIGAALPTAMAVFDVKDGKVLTTLPYHQDVSQWGNLSLGVNGKADRFYLWYRPSDWIPEKTRKTMPGYIEEMDLQGKVLKTYTLPPLPVLPRIPSLSVRVGEWLRSPAFFYGELVYQKIGGSLGNERLKKALAQQLGQDWPRTKRVGIQATALSLFLGLGTFFGARRARFSDRSAWAWAGIAFAFNVAGLLMFRFVADWPRMVPCPTCARKRPVELETCPHCHAGWAGAKREGVEIFDQPAEPPPAVVPA